jgi:hypothetical protein
LNLGFVRCRRRLNEFKRRSLVEVRGGRPPNREENLKYLISIAEPDQTQDKDWNYKEGLQPSHDKSQSTDVEMLAEMPR